MPLYRITKSTPHYEAGTIVDFSPEHFAEYAETFGEHIELYVPPANEVVTTSDNADHEQKTLEDAGVQVGPESKPEQTVPPES